MIYDQGVELRRKELHLRLRCITAIVTEEGRPYTPTEVATITRYVNEIEAMEPAPAPELIELHTMPSSPINLGEWQD